MLAQEPAGALEEVVVTAQRREQSLQEVPISVTAFSGDQLEKLNIKSATNYLALTPNVSVTEDGQSGARGISIAVRGINNLVSGENAFVNSVGIYLDEYSIASVPNGVANPFLPDMERVEVLRGPQGTYFGRNSLGGALNLTSRAPTDKLEGNVSLGGEKYANAGNMYSFDGVLNVPVTDTFRMRLVGSYEKSSGLVKNINPTGQRDSGHDYTTVRLRAVWEPSDRTKLGTTLIYSKENQGTDENVPSGVLDLDTVDTFGFQPGTAFDPGTGFWPENQNRLSHDLMEFNKLDSKIGVVNFAQSISDSLTFKAVAGIIDSTQKRLFDNDLIGNLDVIKRTNVYSGKSWSVETRLEARNTAVDWVVGLLYAKDRQEQFNDVAVSSNATATFTDAAHGTVGFLPPFPAGLGLALNTKNFEVKSYAVFADSTWHVNDKFQVLVGARYTNDDVVNGRTSSGIRPGAPGCTAGFFQCFFNVARPDSNGKRNFSDVSPRIGLRFAASDSTNLYVTASKGYKAGGTSTGNNTNAPGSPSFIVPYEAETLWNYEAGLKMESADRRVRFNASVFLLDWKNLQLEAFRFLTPGDLSSNFEQGVNAKDAEARGFELELLAKPTGHVTFGGAFGYLSSQIKSDTVAEITGGFKVNLKGLVIPKSPKVTANLFSEYRWDGSYASWLRGEWVHRGAQYSDVEAVANQQTLGPSPNQGLTRVVPADEFPYKVPAYTVVNLRGGFNWGKAAIGLYIENAFNEKYYTGTQENFGLSGIRLRPHPRVYGANVKFRF